MSQIPMEYLCIYDPQFFLYAEDFLEEFGLNAAVEPVRCMETLRAVVDKYAVVRYLEVILHGRPNLIRFANGGGMVGSYLGELTSAGNMLCQNARVLFISCNIGDGPVGEKFLSEIGKKMFRGIGGIVGASTVTNFAIPGGFMNPFWAGLLKVRRFDTNGDQVGARDVDQFGRTLEELRKGGCL